MFCDNCGEEIENNSTYCDHCGKAVVGSLEPVLFVVDSSKRNDARRINIISLIKKNYYKIFAISGLLVSAIIVIVFVKSFINSANNAQQSSLTDNNILHLENEIASLKSSAASNSVQNSNADDTRIKELQAQLNQLKNPSKLSTPDVVNKVRPSVVMIRTDSGCGSGMIVESDGTILTNAHVIDGASYLSVYLNDKSIYPGTVAYENIGLDLALIKISGTGLPVVKFGDSGSAGTPLGLDVLALGYPSTCNVDQTLEVETGNITARRTRNGATQGFGGAVGELLQTSARVNPGDSGGPLVDAYGNVVGVNELAGTLGTEYNITGISFAIPSNIVKSYIYSPTGSLSGNTQFQGNAAQSNLSYSQPASNPRQFTLYGHGFCNHYSGATILLTGYPFSYDIEIPSIQSWSDSQVTFTVQDSIPTGTYQITVRGFSSSGYCRDINAGQINVP